LVGAALWLIGAVRRVRRLARYFQLEGYESKRYFKWFGRNRRERGYTLVVIAVLIAAGAGAFLAAEDLLIGVYAGVMAAAALALLILAPRDAQAKQKFNRTPRANRLLILGMALGAVLPAIGIGAWIGAAGLTGAAVAAVFGVSGLLLSPVMMPLANLLLWPYEESRRRYFMRQAKATLKASRAKVIVITGSYGKTTTKHYLQHFLSARYRTLMTPKSFNTLMGISKVINETLAKDPDYEYFIVEADAYFVGENASICRLVEPQYGMVMTVGPMHLERLGSMENIVKAQYEIIEALPADGAGFFNGDDAAVYEMFRRGRPNARIMVSQTGVEGARITARNIRHEYDGLYFDLHDAQTGQTQPLYAPLYGETNVTNILMAAAVAIHLGVPLPDLAIQAASLRPAEHRMVRRVLPDGTTIIDDAYSANPVGTKAALGVLKLHKHSQRRVVVSSGMFELGERAEVENQALGRHMADAATDVILIGAAQAAPVLRGLQAAGFPPDRVKVVSTLDEAVGVYRGIMGPGDTLLMLTDLPDLYAN
jgi:UDP-N-acetylmuramoyl-tripeptide--D-alanyl-D-alanine ligase